MEQENIEKKEKNGLKILVVILLVLLVGVIMFVVGQYTSNNNSIEIFKNSTEETTKNKDNYIKENKIEKKESETTDEEKVLDEITNVYKESYQKMININDSNDSILKSSFEKNNIVYTVNKDVASKYFTDKAIYYLESNSSNIESVLLGSIFNSTDSGKRPLKIVSKNNDTVVATGQIINGVTLDGQSNEIDSDQYPLYIIFKKENNSYKIDIFE